MKLIDDEQHEENFVKIAAIYKDFLKRLDLNKVCAVCVNLNLT